MDNEDDGIGQLFILVAITIFCLCKTFGDMSTFSSLVMAFGIPFLIFNY